MRITGVKPDASRQQRRIIPTMMHCMPGQFRKGGVAESITPTLPPCMLIEMGCFASNRWICLDHTGVESLPLDWEPLNLQDIGYQTYRINKVV